MMRVVRCHALNWCIREASPWLLSVLCEFECLVLFCVQCFVLFFNFSKVNLPERKEVVYL